MTLISAYQMGAWEPMAEDKTPYSTATVKRSGYSANDFGNEEATKNDGDELADERNSKKHIDREVVF